MNRRRALLQITAVGAAVSGLMPGAAQAFQGQAFSQPENRAERNAIPNFNITHFITSKPVVALTFDDGPHPRHTPRLLDMLREYEASATFFVVGRNVKAYPDIVTRMVDEGHEVANHTYFHPWITRIGTTRFFREIDRTSLEIHNVTGKMPVIFRPPYGAIYRRHTGALVGERDLAVAMWSVDPRDWARPGSHVVARRILRQARPGSIILAHDIHSPTVRAMPAVLEGLEAKGLGHTTLSEAMGWRRWSARRFRIRSDHWAYEVIAAR